jgi:hypothetical protein
MGVFGFVYKEERQVITDVCGLHDIQCRNNQEQVPFTMHRYRVQSVDKGKGIL